MSDTLPTPNLNNERFTATIRHLISAGSGSLLAYGIAAGSKVLIVAGPAAFIAGLGLSWAEKHASAKLKARIDFVEDAIEDLSAIADKLGAGGKLDTSLPTVAAAGELAIADIDTLRAKAVASAQSTQSPPPTPATPAKA